MGAGRASSRVRKPLPRCTVFPHHQPPPYPLPHRPCCGRRATRPSSDDIVHVFQTIERLGVAYGLRCGGRVFARRNACKVQYSFQLAVEKEEIQGPQMAFTEGVLLHIRNVRVDLALMQTYDLLDSLPQLFEKGGVVRLAQGRQVFVHRVHHQINIGFTRELFWTKAAKVMIRERRVHSGDEVDKEAAGGGVGKGAERGCAQLQWR
mmetsp:Transcript_4014/g.11765  ORF Transcript_4014/g.11765 Transcript_4014/m.11765 type:complete len:206 (+) Transcript_4014:280-897(+)